MPTENKFNGKVINNNDNIYTFENSEGKSIILQLGDNPKKYFKSLEKNTWYNLSYDSISKIISFIKKIDDPKKEIKKRDSITINPEPKKTNLGDIKVPQLNIYQKLLNVQNELKVRKEQRNNFANYNFRSCEDILAEVKPLLVKWGLLMTISDKIVFIESPGEISETTKKNNIVTKTSESSSRFYVEAIVTLFDTTSEKSIETKALARESHNKKGMDSAQITGASSSYARKYALSGMFCIDDEKDADAT